MMRVRKIAAAVLVAAALALSGCASQYTSSLKSIDTAEVKLPDGRTVVCVLGERGVSCDWEHAQ